MSFYKLESTYRIVANKVSRNRKTYKYYIDSWNSLTLRMQNELLSGGKVAVRTISQAEYIRGLERKL